MTAQKNNSKGTVVALCVVGLLAFAIGFGLFAPVPDAQGGAELAAIKVGPIHWNQVTIKQAIDEVNAQISKDPKNRSRVFLGATLDPKDLPQVSLMLDSLPAEQCVRYIAELSGLRLYSVPEGIILDQMHQDHRSWQRRYSDWVRHTLLQRWYGRMYNSLNKKDVNEALKFADI